MMDPTAPKKNSTEPDPPAAPPAPDPIQPGQFVVSGDEDGVFKQPASPPPQTPSSQQPLLSPDSQTVPANPLPEPVSLPLVTEPPLQASSPAPFPATSPLPPEEPNVPPLNLAGPSGLARLDSSKQAPEAGPPPESNLSPSLSFPSPTEPSPAPNLDENQPNPTPFVPPALGSQPQEEPSRIRKLRLVAIFIGILVLLTAAGAVAWFFVLGNKPQKEPPKTSASEQVEEPQALPKKKNGGFSELPPLPLESTKQATNSASP
ncbi:hypothetical protein HYU92_00630 [Candidatus Curtissbacteria bacterium]|nr:hypothetical protein [Candidatus Curtissbacteria bacterium]